MRLMTELISLEDAQRLVTEAISPTAPERVPIDRASGRVLAVAAVAATDLPPFTSSAMDGFAVRAADAGSGSRLRVVDEAAAGSPAAATVSEGAAVQISTGGVVPAGADAVVPQEDVSHSEDEIVIRSPPSESAHIRPRGADVAASEVVLPAGALVGPGQVGALAAAGVTELQCAKRPRVGIVVTGSELRSPGEPLGPGQLYESNGLMLAAQLGSAGAIPAQLGVVPDDADEHVRTLERALLGFDMVITSGGASVGPHDLVREAQSQLGVREVFQGVAIKPGKPVGFGVRKKHHVFNLPGNPVSALVCFELLVRPAIATLLGMAETLPRYERGTLVAPVARLAARDHFVRAQTAGDDGSRELRVIGSQESHMIVAAASADALVRVDRGGGTIPAGASVPFLRLG